MHVCISLWTAPFTVHIPCPPAAADGDGYQRTRLEQQLTPPVTFSEDVAHDTSTYRVDKPYKKIGGFFFFLSLYTPCWSVDLFSTRQQLTCTRYNQHGPRIEHYRLPYPSDFLQKRALFFLRSIYFKNQYKYKNINHV